MKRFLTAGAASVVVIAGSCLVGAPAASATDHYDLRLINQSEQKVDIAVFQTEAGKTAAADRSLTIATDDVAQAADTLSPGMHC